MMYTVKELAKILQDKVLRMDYEYDKTETKEKYFYTVHLTDDFVISVNNEKDIETGESSWSLNMGYGYCFEMWGLANGADVFDIAIEMVDMFHDYGEFWTDIRYSCGKIYTKQVVGNGRKNRT